MKVGVKQGDPMSPLLFNLALDPLIQSLNSLGDRYTRLSGRSVTTLAFADDLVIVSGSWRGMSDNLRILEAFCKLSGLSIQVKKCHGFLIKPSASSYTINDCSPWSINGIPLHFIGPGESEKYLGVKANPWL